MDPFTLAIIAGGITVGLGIWKNRVQTQAQAEAQRQRKWLLLGVWLLCLLSATCTLATLLYIFNNRKVPDYENWFSIWKIPAWIANYFYPPESKFTLQNEHLYVLAILFTAMTLFLGALACYFCTMGQAPASGWRPLLALHIGANQYNFCGIITNISGAVIVLIILVIFIYKIY